MSTEQQFEKFRENFLLTRCYVDDLYMTYKVKRGLAKAVAKDANELIDRLGLDLVAIPTPFLAQDSICIQPQWMQL